MTWKRLPLLVYSVLAIHMLHLAFLAIQISQMISVESETCARLNVLVFLNQLF